MNINVRNSIIHKINKIIYEQMKGGANHVSVDSITKILNNIAEILGDKVGIISLTNEKEYDETKKIVLDTYNSVNYFSDYNKYKNIYEQSKFSIIIYSILLLMQTAP